MKRITALVIVFCMFLATGICGKAYATDEIEGMWALKNYVDDFGDKTDKKYIGTVSIGEFSNTATSGSKLKVNTIIDYNDTEEPYIRFSLLEYGDIPAVYYDGEDIVLRIKAGGTEYRERLDGEPLNGDIYKLKIKSSDLFRAMMGELITGNDVRCIIDIEESRYNFTISAEGFREIVDKLIIDIAKSGEVMGYSYTFFDYTIGIADECYIGTGAKAFDLVTGTGSKKIDIDDNDLIVYKYWEPEVEITEILEDGTQKGTFYLDGTKRDTLFNFIGKYKDYLEMDLGLKNKTDEEGKGVYSVGDYSLNLSYEIDEKDYYVATVTIQPEEKR